MVWIYQTCLRPKGSLVSNHDGEVDFSKWFHDDGAMSRRDFGDNVFYVPSRPSERFNDSLMMKELHLVSLGGLRASDRLVGVSFLSRKKVSHSLVYPIPALTQPPWCN